MRHLLICIATTAVIGSANAQDAATILNKTAAAYGRLNSYSHTISTTIYTRLPSGSHSTGTTAEARFMRPNRLFVSISGPEVGTVVFACNGREQLTYGALANRHKRRPAPATTTEVMRNLNLAGIVTYLDPLYFLFTPKIPPEMTSLAIKGSEVLDGVKCDIITGQVATAGPKLNQGGVATFWVDRGTSILRKIQIVVKGIPINAQVTVTKNGKQGIVPRKVMAERTITARIQSVQLNPNLDDNAFTFKPPAGSKEVKH